MEKKIINNVSGAPEAVGTYSQGVELNGIFYFSGQIGLNPTTMEMEKDVEGQINQILKNVDALLQSQNLTRAHIFKTTIFLTDLSHFSKINEAYIKYFSAPFPARSCVEVSALPKDALVEIEVLAHK